MVLIAFKTVIYYYNCKSLFDGGEMDFSINRLEHLLISIPVENNENLPIQFSLFITSTKYPGLKKLELGHLTSEERVEKLQKLGKENRFVGVIEVGDRVFAHSHAHFAKQLAENQDLSINGKKVSVVGLTDSQYDQLSLITQEFHHCLEKDKEGDEAGVKRKNSLSQSALGSEPDYLPVSNVDKKQSIDEFIARLKAEPGKIILRCLQLFNEERSELEKHLKKEEERKAIVKEEIAKALLRHEIILGEIIKKST